MNKPGVEIRGVTPDYCMPQCEPDVFTQLCETDILTIQNCDPDIQEVLTIDASISVRNFRVIRSPVGKKLVIHAAKNIEVLFRSGGLKYHSNFYIPFCSCITLDCVEEPVRQIKVFIEDIEACQVSSRTVAVSILALVMAELRADHEPCHTNCGSNSIRCDIKIKSLPSSGHHSHIACHAQDNDNAHFIK